MQELYTRVNQVTKKKLYKFIKDNDVSTLNYNFKTYFESCVEKYDIRILEHHFSNRQIEGLTLINKSGISMSYERENPIVKQNLTKCHELGHFMLNHSGRMFTETSQPSSSIEEREANLFSAVVLMPDIVLLSKIYYRRDSFFAVMNDLEVSSMALKYRLKDILKHFLYTEIFTIEQAIEKYYQNDNSWILLLLDSAKDKIEKEYINVKGNIFKRMKAELDTNHFISSDKYPILLNATFRAKLQKVCRSIKTWVEFDFGKSIGYAWKTGKISDRKAKNLANRILLLNRLEDKDVSTNKTKR
ncbi:protein of unknown function [Streptococcus henryi]|uniref:IrrE N-terminal-like domain-containing protein n=1 Tax=Streptococcus henryi TaxID=439219 RepID=A0A1G6DHZ5_9STRE|nr:ImmA/IrrE family metallo-endopeptidase [Streptococcus henryi]SDB44729.1 protein of unknown function [Streptococcus henryi]